MARILVVEDDKMFLRVVEKILKDQCPSYEIETAPNGLEALRKILLSQKQFDIIVADVDMQPVNGDDLDAIVGMLNRRKVVTTKTLLMSGKVGKRPGDYIEKPFTPDELGAKIGEILDREERTEYSKKKNHL